MRIDAFKELATRAPNLELATIDELHQVVFWAGEMEQRMKQNIRIAQVQGLHQKEDEWTREANALAGFKFDAMDRLGALAKDEPRVIGPQVRSDSGSRAAGSSPSGEPPKWQRLGFKSMDAMRDSEFIHEHKAEANAIKKQASEEHDVASVRAVKEKVRADKAEERARWAEESGRREKEKNETKYVKQHPKYVKEYLDALKGYIEALSLVIAGAKRIKLAPETAQFIATRHGQIRALMAELEATQ
uniref:Uncharacterized protein n=1 Tax=viral metagenome TaxID=1070528 RepID=A0A6M3LF88_9ZZZZ